MDEETRARQERAKARASWPIRKFRLGEEPIVDTRDTSTAEERIALVWRLTLEQWTLAGKEIPTYTRAEMPGRIQRGVTHPEQAAEGFGET